MNRPDPGDPVFIENPSPTTRFAAVGDSFTEGVGDELPDGRVRGWADHVAAGLACRGPVEYVNLAIRGRLLRAIATDQLHAALALGPTVLTFNETVAGLAEHYGVTFVENFHDEELSRAVYWSPDRLHLGPAGHRRVAARVLQTLAMTWPAAGWRRTPGRTARRRSCRTPLLKRARSALGGAPGSPPVLMSRT